MGGTAKRILFGSFIGVALGLCVGAIGFAVIEKTFGSGRELVFSSSSAFTAILGAMLVGVPSLIIGAIISSFRLGKIKSVQVGLGVGLLLLLPSFIKMEGYRYNSGYFDKQLLNYDLIQASTLPLCLCLVAFAVSSLVHKISTQKK